ncbi:hypothetical protein CsSME_00043419 [Camellia sinensis var. sinensis]
MFTYYPSICFNMPLVIRGLLTGYDAKPIEVGFSCDRVVSVHVLYRTHSANVETIPVVCEFPDVFPNDLPGELINREIEFTIDEVPGT